MFTRVELFERIRADRRADPSVSQRELARRHRVSRRTVRAALASAVPPPRKPPVRGRPLALGPVLAAVDEMLRSDVVGPRKQRHTIERICQRLAVEHGFTSASYSTVRNYVARRRPQILAEAREGRGHLDGMVPQVHPPGEEAEVDFAEAFAVVGGTQMKCYLFTLRMSYSGKAVHRVFASQGQEAFMEGHVEAFRVLGGVPTRHIRYDNLKPAVRQVLFGRGRVESQRWVAFRSHYGFHAFYCLPGKDGAHEKGGVEHEGGRFRRNHLVPPPQVASLAVNDRLADIDTAEDARHVHGAPASIGFNFAAEAPLLHPLPADDFELGTTLTPLVRRNARIVVRQCYYSVPARFIDRKVRVSLRANEVLVFDGRQVVARHPRLSRRYDYRDDLDHYLEILLVKPGALAGSTALAQARAEGSFTSVHDAFWAAARTAHGEAEGTRALIEVLLLHRQLPHAALVAGITATVSAGSCSPELVAIEARKAADAGTVADSSDVAASVDEGAEDGLELAEPVDDPSPGGARVISLHTRRLPSGTEHKPPPMSVYDQLLSHRTKGTTA
ncbi:IS21 family transposase [Micromonospora sp. CB01531]|uniref:IS21 family transposase n=1 Tax=Micromonospora sp. CB01531 TaxID=1718947 RepID=UPI00093CF7DC|nr:IS21 family transposase [Micromonospora sp. CB01531]OKI45473.1 transposase [Micromonospora sp. CB01531]